MGNRCYNLVNCCIQKENEILITRYISKSAGIEKLLRIFAIKLVLVVLVFIVITVISACGNIGKGRSVDSVFEVFI